LATIIKFTDAGANRRTIAADPAYSGNKPLNGICGRPNNVSGGAVSRRYTASGREITILFNNAVLLTAQTGSSGQYGGTFPLPYLYVHTAQVQAIYYPTGSDAGTYLQR